MTGPPQPPLRAAALRRPGWLPVAAALCCAAVLYGIFALGRYWAGYDLLAAARQRAALQQRIGRLQATNGRLRAQLDGLRTEQVSRAQERAALGRTLGELQARLAHQTQQLAFYRGVVTQGVNAPSVQVLQLHILPAQQSGHFDVRFALVQALRPDTAVRGTLTLQVRGRAHGSAAALDFAALTAGRDDGRPFRFRYYQRFDQPVVIPPGFQPQQLIVEVQPRRKDAVPLHRAFAWRVEQL